MKINNKEIKREIEKNGIKYFQAEDGTWYKEHHCPAGILYPETEDPTNLQDLSNLSNKELLEKLSNINPMTLRPGFEMEFVMGFKKKFSRFGEKTFVSPKQREIIIKILREKKIK